MNAKVQVVVNREFANADMAGRGSKEMGGVWGGGCYRGKLAALGLDYVQIFIFFKGDFQGCKGVYKLAPSLLHC